MWSGHQSPRNTSFQALWLFMKEAMGSFRQMGTLLPAQSHLARRVAHAVPRREGMSIVELGAGEGCLTRAIIRKLDGLEYRFVVIELSPALLQANREAFRLPRNSREARLNKGRVLFLNENALNFHQALDRLGLSEVTAVVSSLPLFYFSRRDRRRLFNDVKTAVGERGVFVQYRYTPQGIAELEEFFLRVRRRFVMNLLPAWLYTCSNYRRPATGVPSRIVGDLPTRHPSLPATRQVGHSCLARGSGRE